MVFTRFLISKSSCPCTSPLVTVLAVHYSCVLMNNEEHIYIYRNIRLYFYSWRDTWVEQKSHRKEFTLTKGSSGVGRTSEQLTLAKIRELMLSTTPTWPAAILLFHWLWLRPRLTSLFSIGHSSRPCVSCSPLATCPSPLTVYFPVATSMGGRICHHSPSSTTSIGQGDIPIITLLILSSAEWSCQQHPPIQQHLQDMATLR